MTFDYPSKKPNLNKLNFSLTLNRLTCRRYLHINSTSALFKKLVSQTALSKNCKYGYDIRWLQKQKFFRSTNHDTWQLEVMWGLNRISWYSNVIWKCYKVSLCQDSKILSMMISVNCCGLKWIGITQVSVTGAFGEISRTRAVLHWATNIQNWCKVKSIENRYDGTCFTDRPRAWHYVWRQTKKDWINSGVTKRPPERSTWCNN